MTTEVEHNALKERSVTGARPLDSCLAELYKALRALGFYPEGHPLRDENLNQAYRSLASAMGRTELILTVTKNGFSTSDRGAAVGKNPMAQAFARELFIRRVRRLTILPDVSPADIKAFLSILTVDIQKIAASGGIDALMEQQGITTLWANEIDLSAIRAKRKTIENSSVTPVSDGCTSDQPQLNPAANDSVDTAPGTTTTDGDASASPLGIAQQLIAGLFAPGEPVDEGMASLLTRMDRESDDDRYMELARKVLIQCAPLKEADRHGELLPALTVLLKQSADEGKSFTKRGYALFTFEQAAQGKTVDYLVDCLETGTDEQREPITAMLKQMGSQAAGPLIERLSLAESILVRKTLASALVAVGDDAVSSLVSKLHDERWYVVRNVAAILGEIGYTESIEELKKCVQHPDERVRKEIIRSLARIGGAEAESAIITLLSSSDTATRRQAILSLGIMKSRLAVQPLVELIAESDLFMRSFPLKREAVQTLGRIGDCNATAALVQVLTSRGLIARRKRENLKIAAAAALGQLGDRAALPHLEAFAGQNGQLGAACREAIHSIENLAGLTNA